MIVQDKQLTSIRQRLESLKTRGYRLTFRREATCLYCFELQEQLTPNEFSVDQTYYFEDLVNPDADRIIYAISLLNGRKGYLIDACNVYSDNISYELELKLHWQYPFVS